MEISRARVIRKIADGHRDRHASEPELLTRFAENAMRMRSQRW